MYFQNQNVNWTETYNATNTIAAGRNVTGAVAVGDYVIQSGSNITFHAGREITLADGFTAQAGTDFLATIQPFFTCTRYPAGKLTAGSPDEEVNEQVVSGLSVNLVDSSRNIFKVYPNPSSGDFAIEYSMLKNEYAEILLVDNLGRVVYTPKNKSIQKTGTYSIEIKNAGLASGNYSCVLQTESHLETRKLVINNR